MSRLTQFSLLAVCFISIPTYAESDHDDHGSHQLEKQSIFGNPDVMGHLSREPVRVELITRADLEATHAIDLKDALKYTAGLQMRKLRGKSGEGVWLQGYDSDRVAVLIDGLPVAAGTGSSVDINQIALGDVERIEISKGAMSAIYGTSAMGGVVNVITQRPKDGQDASIHYSGGTWGNQDESYNRVPLGKQHTQAKYSISNLTGFSQLVIDNQISNGFRVEGSDKSQGWQGEKTNLSGKTVYFIDKNTEFSLSPRLYREDIQTLDDNFKSGVGNVPLAKIDITDKNYLSALWQQKDVNNGILKLNYSFEDFSNESRQDTVQTARIEQSRNTDITHSGFIAHYELSDNWVNKYIVGIEYLNDSMDVNTRKEESDGSVIETVEVNGKKVENYNSYFQISRQATSNLEWLVSGRLNNNPKYGLNFSPMMNFQYFPSGWLRGDLSLRFGYGHGYRTPNIKELYYFFDHSHLGYVVVGNEDLKPESSKNIQASMEWQPSQATSFDISFYYNRIRDLITSDNEVQELTNEFTEKYGEVVTGNQYGNIENAITAGTEWTFSYSVNSKIKSSIAYAYLYSEDENTGNTLTQRPEHDARLSLDYSLTPKTLASVKYIYTSEQYSDAENQNITPAFAQVDLKLNYDLSKKIKLFGGINNVTGVQKETFDGKDLRPDEGRFVYLGIKLQNLID